MAQRPIQSPDLDSVKRDPNTGAHMDGPARGMTSKRMPKGRASTMIRRAVGQRRMT